MSDQKSIDKPITGVCTNYSPGGYKKPAKPEPERTGKRMKEQLIGL